MKRRIFALSLLLTLVLPLAACGRSGEKESRSDTPLYEAAGVSPSETLLTVDGRDVPAWRYLYWLAYDCGQLEAAYAGAGQELDWESPADGGTTLAEYARQQALSDTALYATVENWAEQYGVQLSEEDQAALEKESASSDAGAYLDYLPALGLGQAEARELLADACLYQRLRALFFTEGSSLAPDAEDVAAFAQSNGYLTLDWIFLSADGQDREASRQQAAELFSQLNASSDPLAAFSSLAGQYSDTPDRSQYAQGRTFLPGGGVLPASVEEAASSLEENQWSGILEADDGFYILLRKPLDTTPVLDDYFDSLLLSAAAGAEIVCEDAYAALEIPRFYAAFQAAAAES